MKTKLHYLIIAILFGLGMNAQTVWLTGNGVGGWAEGGQVKLNTTDNVTYTKIGLEILGSGGGSSEIKFTEGTWATAAGFSAATAAPGFPSGVAEVPGTNIGAVPGFWDVTFNYTTKEYSFIPGVNPNPEIKISGTAVGATDLPISTLDGAVYSRESMTFTDGTAQFIQPGTANTWSDVAFPDGTGTQGGALIPVTAGTYYVYFYRNSGDYSFQPTVVSIIGGFNSWSGDVDMTTTDNVTFTLTDQVFAADTALKFRDNHGWNYNFGSTTNPSGFPSGTGTMSNSTDIAVPSGTYDITFNRSTLAYSFVLKSVPNPVVNITGTALAADVKMSTTDGVAYTKDAVVFAAGDVKFAEEGTANQWSDVAFPSGTGTQAGAPITVPADTFNVSFNKTTGAYSFDHLVISLVGSWDASWGVDIDMTTADGVTYTIANQLFDLDRELKFRVNHGWATSYGSVAPTASSFPSGTAASSGSNNIAVPAGSYSITFDRVALTYSFVNMGVNSFASSNFKVYPNPTSNNWNFSSNNNLQIDSITVTDVLGKVVLVKNASSNEVNVDASTLTNGIYFAKVTANNAVQTIKVIKN